MGYNFVAGDRDQLLLMPPSLAEWLPSDHLAWFVLDVVGELDLSAFRAAYRDDGRGGAAYDPSMMVALVVYAYCVGERSSRVIERRCTEDVAFRVMRRITFRTMRRSLGSGRRIKMRSLRCSVRFFACARGRG